MYSQSPVVVGSGTITVPAGSFVHDYHVTDDGSGTATIIVTPKGGVAQSTIPLRASETFDYDFKSLANEVRPIELGGGSTIAVANVARAFAVFC